MAKLAMVVAVAQNGVIGKDNALPWRLPRDLQYFKATTMGHPIIMGRLTYESIGRPLPGRTNIVVTRQEAWSADGVEVVHSLPAAIECAEKLNAEKEWVMLIGGANLYKQALILCERLYLTEVHADVDGDAYFPEFDRASWNEISRQRHESDSSNPYAYSFVVLDRAT
ncbi:MAG: dihydrofolate reductase [Agarilytica sp.]